MHQANIESRYALTGIAARSINKIGRFLFGLALSAAAGAANSGVLVVSGDITPIFSLTDAAPNPAVPGNGTFFSNILGSGTRVAVLRTSLNPGTENEVNGYYSSLPGVTSAAFNGPVTATSLQGIDLLIAPIPDHAFNVAETTALEAFLQGGGSIFLMGETTTFATTNAQINTFLSAIGSGLSLTNATLDIGSQIASGSRIAVDPLTNGVTQYGYGSTSIVQGGTPLFFTSNNQPFVAYETFSAAVPEPATFPLLATGIVLLRRSRRRMS